MACYFLQRTGRQFTAIFRPAETVVATVLLNGSLPPDSLFFSETQFGV